MEGTKRDDKRMKLNVGCGYDLKEGFVNIDSHNSLGADVVHCLPDPLPYKDGCIDLIYCSHVLEDFLYEYLTIINDFHRVLKVGGVLHIRVPYKFDLGNPHHKRFFDESSFKVFFDSKTSAYSDVPKFDVSFFRVKRYNPLFASLLKLLFNNKSKKAFSSSHTKEVHDLKFTSKVIAFIHRFSGFKKIEIEIKLEKL